MIVIALLILCVNIALVLAIQSIKKSKSLLIVSWILYVPVGVYSFYMSLYCISEIGQAEKSRQISCKNNLKQIGLALKMYAVDNDGYFPDKDGAEGLEMLRVSGYLNDLYVYQCPSFRKREEKENSKKSRSEPPLSEDNVSYEYLGGYKVSNSKDIPIAWDKANNHRDYGNVLYIDGRVIGYNGTDWLKNTKKERTKSLQGTEYSP